VLKFEWDPVKASTNRAKHGVSFEEAVSAFYDPLAATVTDPDTAGEYRFVTIGRSASGRLLVVVYADWGHTLRIISARRANRHEKRAYEEEV
jgi:hypothetical protein